MASSCFYLHCSSHSKKNKVISKGILLYHSFYKPYHIQSLPPREQQIVGAVVASCKQSEGMRVALSDFLQQHNPSLSSFELQRLLRRLSCECGVSVLEEQGSVLLRYDPVLHVP